MSGGSNLSRRDRMIAAVGGVMVLYALAVCVWFMSQEQAWRVASKKYAAAVKKTNSEKRLISQRGKWYDAYEEEREKMPDRLKVFGDAVLSFVAVGLERTMNSFNKK